MKKKPGPPDGFFLGSVVIFRVCSCYLELIAETGQGVEGVESSGALSELAVMIARA